VTVPHSAIWSVAFLLPPLDHLVRPLAGEIGPKLVERADDVEEELPLCGRQVDILFQTDEINTVIVEVIDVVQDLLERSAEPREFTDNDRIVLLCLVQEAVVCVTLSRLATDSDVLVERDVVVVGVGPLFETSSLVLVASLCFLFFCRDADVAGEVHAVTKYCTYYNIYVTEVFIDRSVVESTRSVTIPPPWSRTSSWPSAAGTPFRRLSRP
jgi:hypothetical protein